jgi:hypothetical protein
MIRTYLIAATILAAATPLQAQSLEASVIVPLSQWSEFEGADLGVGGRLTWKPIGLVGLDADLAWYPTDFPSDVFAFSGGRVEAMFGLTVGPRLGPVRPFGKAAAGFLVSAEAPAPFPCIAIFPPPLNCLMGAGETLPAFEFGGGVELAASSRAFFRADATSRLLEYPGPSLRFDPRVLATGQFWGGAFRVTLAAGVRF